MTLCDSFYHYYDLALGIAILKPVQYIQRVPKILFGCLHWFEIYLQESKNF